MSNIALGQAASVEKLICTSELDLSGALVTPNQQSYGSAAAPIDMTGANPVIAAGNFNKVSVYGYNTALNTLTFTLTTTTAGVRNHSFIVSYQSNQVLGAARTATYAIYPITASTGTSTTIVVTFSAAILAVDSQRVTVFILRDS